MKEIYSKIIKVFKEISNNIFIIKMRDCKKFCLKKEKLPTPQPLPTPSYDYVEIAGVKWATMNIGALSETDYGNHYVYGAGSVQYSESGGNAYLGQENPLTTSADTATQVWGDNWRIPTKDECLSLLANTNYEWIEDFNGSGVNGGKFTDKTDSSKYIFIPAAGYYVDTLLDEGLRSGIWTSTPNGTWNAYYMYSSRDYGKGVETITRGNGFSVRAILAED